MLRREGQRARCRFYVGQGSVFAVQTRLVSEGKLEFFIGKFVAKLAVERRVAPCWWVAVARLCLYTAMAILEMNTHNFYCLPLTLFYSSLIFVAVGIGYHLVVERPAMGQPVTLLRGPVAVPVRAQ